MKPPTVKVLIAVPMKANVKMEIVNKSNIFKIWHQSRHSVHEATDRKGANCGANESKCEDGANVAEKIFFLHGISSVENNRRKKNIEKYFRVKSCFFVNFAFFGIFYFALEIIHPSFVVVLHSYFFLCLFCPQIKLIRRSTLGKLFNHP